MLEHRRRLKKCEKMKVNIKRAYKTFNKYKTTLLLIDLGLMATISAVLYANTEHANLKESYPNWTDRCKQIIKRWRSLCNEKKAPFLQKAKDNRSALRQRREQCKVSQPPKLEKQDDGRAWKNQPCKPKEDQSNMFGNRNNCKYIFVIFIFISKFLKKKKKKNLKLLIYKSSKL